MTYDPASTPMKPHEAEAREGRRMTILSSLERDALDAALEARAQLTAWNERERTDAFGEGYEAGYEAGWNAALGWAFVGTPGGAA